MYYDRTDWRGFDSLVGKTVDFVYYSDREDMVAVCTADGVVYKFGCRGDCCARAYFADIEEAGFDQIVGQKVLTTDDNYGGEFEGSDRQNDVFFYVIKTAKGMANVELRVAHNGYYGGQISLESVTEPSETAEEPGEGWKLLAGVPRCVIHPECREVRDIGVECARYRKVLS